MLKTIRNIAVMASLVASAATTSQAGNADGATLFGGLVGGAIANEISNHNPIFTAIGALVGANIATHNRSTNNASYSRHTNAPLQHNPHNAHRMSEHEKKILDDKMLDQVGWNALRTGHTQNWENPVTGSWGQVRVSPIYAKGEFFCRNFESRTIRNDRIHGGSGYACKVTGSDIWTVMN